MSYYHFKPAGLQAYIFLKYEYQNSTKSLLLLELTMLKNKKEILKMIEAKKLKSVDSSNLIENEILENVEMLFKEYFSGKPVDLFTEIQKINVDLDLKNKYKSEFAFKVFESLIRIKFGETTSYFEIGAHIGSNAYRAIGNTCRNNPIPLIVPCHRVLKKDGEIGGFMGKNSDSEWETNLKRELLTLERAKLML